MVSTFGSFIYSNDLVKKIVDTKRRLVQRGLVNRDAPNLT